MGLLSLTWHHLLFSFFPSSLGVTRSPPRFPYAMNVCDFVVCLTFHSITVYLKIYFGSTTQKHIPGLCQLKHIEQTKEQAREKERSDGEREKNEGKNTNEPNIFKTKASHK